MVQLGIQFGIDHFPPVPPPQPRYICISFYCLQVSIAAIETSSATQISIFYLLFLTAFKIVPLGGGNEWRRSLNILHIHCDVPLISLGAVPHHHLALSVKELTYSSNS